MEETDAEPKGVEPLPHHGTSLVTLFELKSLGRFSRYQDRVPRLDGAGSKYPLAYPLFATGLNPNKYVDLLLKDAQSRQARWELVEFITRKDGDIYFRQGSREDKVPFSKYGIAPAGLYTAYDGDVSTIDAARLSEDYKPPYEAFISGSEVQSVSAPYVTFKIDEAYGRGSWGWTYETFHVADPRIEVPGVVPVKPFYNSPIAVSHRWLSENHPDPNGMHCRELLALSENMGLLDCQTFFIDYCSLPQSPRTSEEDALFRRELPHANRYYQQSTIILIEEVDDYDARAWCMFEMILSSVRNAILNKDTVEGKLKAAFDLARSFVDTSRANFEAKRSFGIMPGRTISPQQFSKWARGSLGMNLAYDQMQHRNRQSILDWFHDHDVKATNMDDIPVIVGLLEKLL